MTLRKLRFSLHALAATAAFSVLWLGWNGHFLAAQATVEPSFDQHVKPLLTRNCVNCHNVDNPIAGVRVDNLTAGMEERQIRYWEAIRHRVKQGSMPPKGMPHPSPADKEMFLAWVDKNLEVARLRPAPKNGSVRRLTVAQYRNTLRDLLQLDDDFTELLPPDAVSSDGFLNNKDTLQLSPLLLETYLEIADQALSRALVDPSQKPHIQNFRMDLGAGINKSPLPEELILGANSLLLDNKDFTVTQLKAAKPFAFEPFYMRTKYRFIEGYAGNATVRGWRDFDSIYHSVFACMRGSRGYPKGDPYNTVPEGLLLRPAIPNDEIFTEDGTYGPKANFKISLRELPDYGRFRVTVTAARYNDGLMLDTKATPFPADAPAAITAANFNPTATVTIPKAGIYQVDAYPAPRVEVPPVTDPSKLTQNLTGSYPLDGDAGTGKLQGNARYSDSPFGKAVTLNAADDEVVIPRESAPSVGASDFTIAAWINPRQLKKAGIVGRGGFNWAHGWSLQMPDNKGILRLETAAPNNESNGEVATPAGTLRANAWQHVAAVVNRAKKEAVLYVNGYPVAKGEIGEANLDNPRMDLRLGRLTTGQQFRGEIDEVRVYQRALAEAELQALVQPGRRFVKPPPEKPQPLTLTLADRSFSGPLAPNKHAFTVVRLNAGPLPVSYKYGGMQGLAKVVLTPLPAADPLTAQFASFEKRVPRLGVHLGLRRDCGSTFAPVGTPVNVAAQSPTKFVFEGAIRNYPSPDVEKDNVNYLAGVREIAVRSEFTDGRDMPRLLIKSIEFEGPYFDAWPPATHKNIFIDSPNKSNPQAYARTILRNFATRAYRRPPTAQEEAAIFAVFSKSFNGSNFQSSVKDALQVVLTSPQFLFLTETSTSPAPEPIESYELASKLSYFLWNGPPDRTALQLARSNSLRQQLNAEVNRMIADPRFSHFIREFTAQWLSLDKFQVLEPDRKRFPRLNRDVRAHLKMEPVHYVSHLIRNNLPVRNLIASDFIVANEAVASYYDLGEKTDNGFDYVAIRHDRKDLGGLFGQAALMAGLSDGRESNPVKRGAWLARKIIAEPPADPPPNVPALSEDAKGLTLRQRIEQHRSQPACQQCHSKIDPWGVALEEFDASGRLKTQPVDASSKLPDSAEVAGFQDLKKHLSENRIDQVAFSVLKHLTIYASGRALTYNEINNLKQDGLKLKAGGYRMRDMIHYVVNSKVFLEK